MACRSRRFLVRQPGTDDDSNAKVEDNNKKPNRFSSDGTKAQRCKQPKFQRSSALAAIPMFSGSLLVSEVANFVS